MRSRGGSRDRPGECALCSAKNVSWRLGQAFLARRPFAQTRGNPGGRGPAIWSSAASVAAYAKRRSPQGKKKAPQHVFAGP